MFNRIKLFLAESREEFKRVNWPTRNETTKMVFVVVIVSTTVALFLGTLDYVFIELLAKIIS